jgi:hypothetical protein
MEHVKRAGSNRDKYNAINSLAYNQFMVAVANKQHTATWTLLECGVAASSSSHCQCYTSRHLQGDPRTSKESTELDRNM